MIRACATPFGEFGVESLEPRALMSAPVIHNPHLPVYGPVDPGQAPLTLTYETLVDHAAITTDSGEPAELVLQPVAGDLAINGVLVSAGDTLGPGQSVVWSPGAASAGMALLFSIEARDREGTSDVSVGVSARVRPADTGEPGPFDVTPGARIDAMIVNDDNAGPEVDVTVRNDVGDVILFSRADRRDEWRRTDLTDDPLLALFPRARSNVLTWTDPKDERRYTYGAALTDDGLQLLTVDQQGRFVLAHRLRNLNTEVVGAPLLVGSIRMFSTSLSFGAGSVRVYIVGRTESGDVVVFHQTSNGTPGDYEWTAENLYESQLRANGREAPALVGDLVTYTTPWNGLNVAGLDSSGNIWVIWTSPQAGTWYSSNLTAISGGSPISGGLCAMVTPWQGINLAGLDPAGHVTVTWWAPALGGEWRSDDLSARFGLGSLRATSMAARADSWGSLNIVGLDGEGNLHEFYWNLNLARQGQDVWTDFTVPTPGVIFGSSAICGVTGVRRRAGGS